MPARPLLAASLALVCGAGLGAWLPQEPAAWAWAAAALIAGWAVLLCAGALRAGTAAGLAAFTVLGVLRCQSALAPLYAGAEKIAEGEAVAAGRLARPPQPREGETLLFLEGARLRRAGATGSTSALALPLQMVVAGTCGGFEVGDLIVARGSVRPPRGDRNLGWFPGPVAPWQSRCAAWLIVNSPAWVHRVGHDPGSGPGAAVLRWRAAAHRFWNSRPGAPGAILDALTTGERAAIPRDLQEAFTASGLAHVLAISGMNVAFLAALVFLILRRVLALCQPLVLRVPAQPLAAGLTLPALWFFLLFSGGQIPVGRAVLTSGAALAAALAWRRIAPAEALAAAALAIVAGDPRALFSPSFQLSFAATAALLLVAPRLAPPLHRLPAMSWRARALRRARQGVNAVSTASLAASAATAPLVAFHFQQVSIVGPAANLVAVPLTGLVVLPAAWLTLAAQALPQPLGAAAAAIALHAAEALIAVARWFAAPVWASVATARPPPLLTLLLVCVAALLLPPATARLRRWRAIALAAAAAAGSWWAVATHGRGLLVAFLDVGQGLAVAVRAPGGGTFLYDAGPRWRDYDAGERIVVPALRGLGAWRLEGFSVSHGHPDHSGGSAAVRAAFAPPGGLAGAGRAEPGARRSLGGGATLRVLGPPGPAAAGNENDRSLALLICFGRTGIVLTGDAGPAAVPGIIAAARPHPPRLALQAPHHGGSPEACGALAAALRPEVSVIPVGRNGYGHPKPGATAALAAHGRVLRTDRDGAVFVRSDGVRLATRTWQELAAGRTWAERLRWLAAGW